MKKLISLFLAMFMFVSNFVVASASENTPLYAYTVNSEGFDQYAIENLTNHMLAFYGYVDNDLKLGQGINVFGDVSSQTFVYPIWKNNEIVATFKVVSIEGEYSGSYSEGNVQQLNFGRTIATAFQPLVLFKSNDKLLLSVKGNVYDAVDNVGKIMNEFNLDSILLEELIIGNGSFLDYKAPFPSRASTSWHLPWNVPDHNPTDNAFNYAYCLSAVLRNLGYIPYTVAKIKSDMRSRLGDAYTFADLNQVKSYLNDKGFIYQSTNTYLAKSVVISKIYDERTYIFVRLTHSNGQNKFYGIITGYATTNGNTAYQLYEPRSSSINGRCTMDSSTRVVINSRGETFTWNSGYITNIVHQDY